MLADSRSAGIRTRTLLRFRTADVDTLARISERGVKILALAERVAFIESRPLVHLAVGTYRALRHNLVDARCDEELARHGMQRIVAAVVAARQRLLAVLRVPAKNLIRIRRSVVHAALRPIEEHTAVEALQIFLDLVRQRASFIRLRRTVRDVTREVHAALADVRRLPIGQNVQRAASDNALAVDGVVALCRRDFIVREDGIVLLILLEGVAHRVILVVLCVAVGCIRIGGVVIVVAVDALDAQSSLHGIALALNETVRLILLRTRSVIVEAQIAERIEDVRRAVVNLVGVLRSIDLDLAAIDLALI